MLFENEAMLQKRQGWTKLDGELCRALRQLLSKDEPDVILHAAEAVASLVMLKLSEMYLTDLVFRE